LAVICRPIGISGTFYGITGILGYRAVYLRISLCPPMLIM
jgi:hypothetical protein